ncbi:MAG TPA: IS110 family transposase [Thermoplasmata archaeon]|nr:IS110 family transposase [Thermoplasmata archaeon]
MNEEREWTPSPCLGLDVHKSTTTATYLSPDGKPKRAWTFSTTRGALVALRAEVDASVPIVLEASTAGKAVAHLLKEEGWQLHMASPRDVGLIAKSSVKIDQRDSEILAHLFQAGFLPECYVPPPEIDRMRSVVRERQDLGRKAALVKNQVHALVTRNLLDGEMRGVTDWFAVKGLRTLTALPLGAEERAVLARSLRQLSYLASQENDLQRELAQLAVEREDVRLLMTIPGVDYYTAVALVAEIGDIRRFPTKRELASYAGLVPRADNSGDHVSWHRRVKPGDLVLKRFLCNAVMGMQLARQETAVKRFYQKKSKQIGQAKAQVAAARKLSAAVWWILTNRQPYREQDEGLSARKGEKLDRVAATPPPTVSAQELSALGEELLTQADTIEKLGRVGQPPDFEEKREGNG